MKQLKLHTLLIFLTISLLSTSFEAVATHLMGGQITYTYVSGNTYTITLTLYRDCDGIGLGSTAAIGISGAASTATSLSRIAVNDVSILCPGEVSSCNGGTTPGIEEHIYQGNVTLSTAGAYTFSYSSCCRNTAINTLSSPGNAGIYLSTELNTLLTPGNSSPNFLNKPIGNYCIGAPSSLSPNGSDPDGDVIVYSLVNAREAAASSVSYSAGFSGTNPLSSSTPIVINPNTGEISFTPNAAATQVAVMAFKAEEYRVIGGVSTKIGEVYRDIQVRLATCGTNGAPVISAVPNAIVPVGQNYCVNINATDSPTQNITLTAVASIIPPATFNVTSSGPGFANSTFCFTPQASDAGNTYTISVNAQDDVCDSVTTSVRTWNITVPNTSCSVSISSSSTSESCAGNDGTATANLVGGTPPYSYSWNGPNGYSSFAGPTLTGLEAGSYTVNISDANNCAESAVIIVNDGCAPPPPPPSSCAATATFRLFGVNLFWQTAGANDPNVFYQGVTQKKRVRTTVSGGVGPYTYSWSNSEGYQLVHQSPAGNTIQLLEPLGPSYVICEITDVGAGCTFKDSVFVDWSDEFYCGDINSTDPQQYWRLKMCMAGVDTCMYWNDAKAALTANTATMGNCTPKTDVVSKIADFAVYPNPTNGIVNINFTATEMGEASLSVVDVNGRVLYTQELETQTGLTEAFLDLSPLANGMYFVRLSTANSMDIQKLQIAK